MKKPIIILICLGLSLVHINVHAFSSFFDIFRSNGASSNSVKKIANSTNNLNQNVLKLALTAYNNAKKNGLVNKSTITVVDYSIPSSEPRMWVIDLKSNKVKYALYVAHGNGSGMKEATNFSNVAKTRKSSIGVFLTGSIYSGKHGESLHLHGLEEKFNTNAYSRAIVVHGAAYVSEDFVKQRGRLGRSFGCFAINQKMVKPVINDIKNGTMLFAYYPDKSWLKSSKFLTN